MHCAAPREIWGQEAEIDKGPLVITPSNTMIWGSEVPEMAISCILEI